MPFGVVGRVGRRMIHSRRGGCPTKGNDNFFGGGWIGQHKKNVGLQCGCSVPAAEWLDSSAMGIAHNAQLVAHEAGHSLRERWLCNSSQMTLVAVKWKDVLLIFFAEYVNQIWIWCIFNALRYASAVQYAVAVCPSIWCGCSVPAAEWLDSSAAGIAQLADAAGESILCREWWRRGSSQMTLGTTCHRCCYYGLCAILHENRRRSVQFGCVAAMWTAGLHCLLHWQLMTEFVIKR